MPLNWLGSLMAIELKGSKLNHDQDDPLPKVYLSNVRVNRIITKFFAHDEQKS